MTNANGTNSHLSPTPVKIMAIDYQSFANEWESAWNSHDLERILSHYSDDIIFRSAKALSLVGNGEIHGKQALRDYWGKALKKQPNLKFKVLAVFHGFEMLVITYKNHHGVIAAETLKLDKHGVVIEASACHSPI